jgi:hypothetical protein
MENIKMKKQNQQIVIYRRSFFGFLVKVAAFNKYQFEAVISTAGALRVNRTGCHREGVIAAYAPGEWSVCTCFIADHQSKN